MPGTPLAGHRVRPDPAPLGAAAGPYGGKVFREALTSAPLDNDRIGPAVAPQAPGAASRSPAPAALTHRKADKPVRVSSS